MSERVWLSVVGGTLTAFVFAVALLFTAGALAFGFAGQYVLAGVQVVMALSSMWGAMALLVSLVRTVKKMKIKEREQ